MKNQGWRTGTMAGFGILAVWFVACAGDDIPPVEDDFRGALATSFGGEYGQVGAASGANAGGSGGGGTRPPPSGGRGGSANTGGGAGGAGGGDPVGGSGSGNGGGNVCDAYDTIIEPSCALTGCHGSGSRQGDFSGGETVMEAFVDKASIFDTCDQPYIAAGNAEESLIYTKVTNDFAIGDCGNLQMPANGNFLDPAEEECLLDWLGQF